jgi:hypothetical protein
MVATKRDRSPHVRMNDTGHTVIMTTIIIAGDGGFRPFSGWWDSVVSRDWDTNCNIQGLDRGRLLSIKKKKTSTPVLEPTQPPIQRVCFPGVKRSGRELDQSPPLVANFRMSTTAALLHTCIYLRDVCGDNFTLLLLLLLLLVLLLLLLLLQLASTFSVERPDRWWWWW